MGKDKKVSSKRFQRPSGSFRDRDVNFNKESMVYVPMDHYAIAGPDVRAIATEGCGPCVAVTIRNENCILLAHISDDGTVDADKIFLIIQKLVRRFLAHAGGRPVREICIVQNGLHRGGRVNLYNVLEPLMRRFGAFNLVTSNQNDNGAIVGHNGTIACNMQNLPGDDALSFHNEENALEYGAI